METENRVTLMVLVNIICKRKTSVSSESHVKSDGLLGCVWITKEKETKESERKESIKE